MYQRSILPPSVLNLNGWHNSITKLEQRSVEAKPLLSLGDFIAGAWSVLEPGTEYVHNWHIDAICDHLEAVSRREIRDLIINMPPRFMKSTLVSVMWPVWEWTWRPSTRWLTASYALPLSIRDALKSRRVIQSPWFQERFGDVFQMTGDQNQKSRYENDRAGYRLAISTGAGTTGEGGDTLILDDPHNVKQAESDVKRTSALDWIDQAWSTRRNDPKRSARVVVMQRLHEQDATGHLLEQGGWEHLCLPQEYEPRVQVSAIGWQDPRTVDGEPLWPERFGPKEVEGAKRELGSYGYAGQHGQRPAPRGGGMFKREWWQYYDVLPTMTRVEQYIDSGFKTGVSNDPSAIVTWGMDGVGNYYVIDLWNDRKEYPDLIRAIHDQHAKQTAVWTLLKILIIIEDKASGQSAIQSLRRPAALLDGTVLPALPVTPFPVPGNKMQEELARLSKEARAEGTTPLIEGGRVFLPNPKTNPSAASWVQAFILQHQQFPNGVHDEFVDCTSMALARLPRAGVRAY